MNIERGIEMERKEQQHPVGTAEPPKKKQRKPRPVQQATELAFKALIRQGFSASKASTFLGMHPTTGSKILKRLKEQGEGLSGFLSTARDEKLGRLVDHFMDKGVKLRAVKGSDALGAAKIYADRRYPAREAAPPISMSFTNVFIHEARLAREPAGQVIDIDPGPGEEPPEGPL